MPQEYLALKERIEKINDDLKIISERISEIKPQDRAKYPQPHLRLWSGDAKDLEKFTTGLEDWIRQPEAAEARRCLAEISGWTLTAQPRLEELISDLGFLSDNSQIIGNIHNAIFNINHNTIKKSVSSYVLARLFEKDIVKANIWSMNASAFSEGIDQFDVTIVNSDIAKQVKKDAIKELISFTSFAEPQLSQIENHTQLLVKAEELANSCPDGISEKVLLESYKLYKDTKSPLDQVIQKLTRVRKLMVNLEWIIENQDFACYADLWAIKQRIFKAKNLDNIIQILGGLEETAAKWKETRKEEIGSILAKLNRMSKSLKQDDLLKGIKTIEVEIRSVDWNKPNVGSLQTILENTKIMLDKMRSELLGRLKNPDAMSIVENPEIITDLGEERQWTFDRFMKALGLALKEGLIDIEAVEKQ